MPDELEGFKEFWQHFFPEAQTMSREEALARTDDGRRGQISQEPDDAMTEYQDAVARVYGAYEQFRFQEQTMRLIGSHVKLPINRLVSLGCGPATYELWLLSKGMVEEAVLVDQSPQMLERALGIARELQVDEKLQFVCQDAKTSGLAPKSADAVFCVNAMHWSRNWQQWVRETTRLGRFGAQVFITCSLLVPRSQINPSNLEAAVRRQIKISQKGPLMPPEIVRGVAMQSSRYYVVGRKK